MLMIVAHAAELAEVRSAHVPLAQQLRAARQAVAALPAERYPMVRAHAEALFAPSAEQRVRWSLQFFLHGAAETPVPDRAVPERTGPER